MPKDGKEAFVRRKKAARRDGRRGGKGQGSKEADGRVKERKDVGAIDAVRSSSSERMPEKPSTARQARERSIGRMNVKEMTLVTPAGSTASR